MVLGRIYTSLTLKGLTNKAYYQSDIKYERLVITLGLINIKNTNVSR